MVGKIRSGKYIKFLIYLIAIVLLNLAGITLFYRLDLTQNQSYSISRASQRVVDTLSEPLTINVFFTKNLPAPHNNTERYLHDLLEEYSIYANRYFNYRFYDVSPDEGDIRPEARANQELAKNYGINPIQIQVIDEDEVKFQKAYMGLVVIHGDMIERIPTITSIERIEYQLTTAIMKLNNKISALLRLREKIGIKLYLSSSLGQVAAQIGLKELLDMPRKVEQVVESLNPKHFNKLAYTYLDPSKDPKAANELELKKYNVLSLKWPEIKKENIPAGAGSVGLVLEYDGRAATIQMINVLRLPIIGTRYQLVNLDNLENMIVENIESLIDINEDMGYLAGKGSLPLTAPPAMNPAAPQQPQEALNSFRTAVSQNYSLKNINLKEGPIPTSLNTLVIARPTEKFTDYELFQIDQFLMQGKNLALFLDGLNEVFPGAQQQMGFGMNRGPQYLPNRGGLEKLLAHYGIRIKESYIMDENCFKQEMPQTMGGGERPIYFAPLIQNRFINKDLGFMQNIKRLVAVKISPLELLQDRIKQNGLQTHRLFSSSEKSWQMRGQINLNPMFISPPKSEKEQQSYPLAYLLQGEFPSYFQGKPIPEKEPAEENKTENDKADQESKKQNDQKPAAAPSEIESAGDFVAKGKPGKIFLIASSEMLKDNVIDPEGRSANAVFILNVLDSLNNREDVAVMRNKKQSFNPLNDISGGTRTFVKTFNIAGLPVLVVIFGIFTWFRRTSRKKHIQEMFQR